ncbi:MAG: STAS/SEC14 domain-containing protein [Rhodospirillales bacterium]|nr:STAS/SEC14 domain-containing protein [Alphaproteobacteria bacterium]MCB9976798.1 STAS/SEC14 domain-containing protein [Rhodospirillales bacterium]
MALKLEYKVLSVETHGRVLHGIVSGKLEKEDYDLLVPEAERLIEKSGKIRVLVELIDFKGWSAGALWEECKFAYHHLKDVERMAMVGDRAWEKGLTVFMKPFVGAELRYFDVSERQAAVDWIEDGLADSAAA